jgi:CRP-like cAMP-binding protein
LGRGHVPVRAGGDLQRDPFSPFAICDRVGDAFPLTHQHLADLIGVNRTTVSLLALSFRRSGLIETTRAHIRVIDRKRLLAGTCDCYDIIGKKFLMALA